MTLPKATDSLPHAGGLSRRGLLKAGLGLTGFAGLMMPSTAAYAAAVAANDLVVTNYRLSPPGWRNCGSGRSRMIPTSIYLSEIWLIW